MYDIVLLLRSKYFVITQNVSKVIEKLMKPELKILLKMKLAPKVFYSRLLQHVVQLSVCL